MHRSDRRERGERLCHPVQRACRATCLGTTGAGGSRERLSSMTAHRRSGSTDLVRASRFREAAVSFLLLTGAAVSLMSASILSVITSR